MASNPASTANPSNTETDNSNDKNAFFFTTIVQALLSELSSPTNLILTLICIYLIYKIFFQTQETTYTGEVKKYPPPLPKHDMTVAELRQYDGKGEDGRICVAINRKIFDVSKGDRFYGPNKSYSPLAGRDATRALGLFEIDLVKDQWDDYENITQEQWNTIHEWEQQFNDRYEFVGNLVKEVIEKEEDSFERIEETKDE